MSLQLTVLLTWVRIVSHQCLSFVTTMGDICQKCCFQAMERPLPKLKMKRSQHGLISRVHFSEFETTEITNTQDISEQEWKSSQESYLIPSAKSPISTAQVEFWIGQDTRSLLAESWHHLKNSTKLIQSAPRTRCPRTEAQTNENKIVDTVCHQSLFDRQCSSPEFIAQGYFHQMILGLDLVEMRVECSR